MRVSLVRSNINDSHTVREGLTNDLTRPLEISLPM
jgi:hypothetical protein